VVALTDATGLASASTLTVAVDCLGYDSLSVDVGYRSIANTAAPSVVSLRHSDTDGSYVTVASLIQNTVRGQHEVAAALRAGLGHAEFVCDEQREQQHGGGGGPSGSRRVGRRFGVGRERHQPRGPGLSSSTT
jgi:hypothetical protein